MNAIVTGASSRFIGRKLLQSVPCAHRKKALGPRCTLQQLEAGRQGMGGNYKINILSMGDGKKMNPKLFCGDNRR